MLSTPFTDPNFLCSYSYWKPGQYTGFSGYEGVRQGNIHFAGEHCSTDFQGFMEGAASEGVRAANEILVRPKQSLKPNPLAAMTTPAAVKGCGRHQGRAKERPHPDSAAAEKRLSRRVGEPGQKKHSLKGRPVLQPCGQSDSVPRRVYR